MISFNSQIANSLFNNSNNYSIPVGYIARNDQKQQQQNNNEENKPIRFYTEEITLDSSVFIFKSKNRVSFVHIDSNYNDRINLDKIEEELQYVLSDQDNGDEIVMVWRCFNIPFRKDAVERQLETNSYIEVIWKEIQNKLKEKLKGLMEFREINVIESISISLADKSPLLQRIPDQLLKVSKINQKLLNSISIINDFVDPSIQLKNPPENIIIFENGVWNDQLINQMTTPNQLANEFLLNDPNQYDKFLDSFLKIHNSINSTQLNNFIDQLFQAIDVYRESLNKSLIKKLKVGPNDVCPCKSKQKFKKCHGTIKNGINRKTYLEY